jgi:hypothetical protein
MSAARTSISMPESLMNDAIARQHEKRLASFSDYVQELIREDLKEHPPEFREMPKAVEKYPRPAQPVTYSKGKGAATGNRGTPRKPRGPQN